MKHTPGPWTAGIAPEEPVKTFIIGAGNCFFCSVRPRGTHVEEAEANARLISEAPALLDALIAIKRDHNLDIDWTYDKYTPDSIKCAYEVLSRLDALTPEERRASEPQQGDAIK